MNVLVLGGTRFLGRRVVRLLLDAGAEVTVAQRGRAGSPPEGAAHAYLDRATGEGLAALCQLRPRIVVDLSGYRSDWVRDVLELSAGRGMRYLFVSSGAVYRPSEELPWPESAPYGPMPLWGDYGHQKIAAEQMLWAAHAEGAIVAAVLRFPFVLGPGDFADREAFVCSRIQAGRPLLLAGGGTAVNQFVHVDDAAEAIVRAVLQPDRSAGEAFNCGYARAVTNRGFVALCAQVLGERAQTIAIDPASLGVEAEVWDLSDLIFPFPDEHYVLDVTRLRERLGFEPLRSTREAIEDFVAAWKESEAPDRGPRRYKREERALAALNKQIDGRTV